MNPGGSQLPARAIGWSIGLAPVALILMTWGDNISATQQLARSLALPVLAVELSVIVLSLLQGNRIKSPPAYIGISLAALMVVAWMDAITADHPETSIIRTSIWTIHLFFSLAIINIFKENFIKIDDVIKYITCGFIIFIILFILFRLHVGNDNRDWDSNIPAYGNIRWFGYYAATTTGLCAWGWIRGRTAYWAIAALSLGAALWTGSRGMLAAAIGSYAILFVIFPFARKGVTRFAAMIAAGLMLAIILTWIMPLGEQGPQRLLGGQGDNGRIEVWLKAARGIAERPWFGWGEGQFHAFVQPQPWVQPHNIVLQILFAWGFVGGVLIAILATWLATRVYRAANPDTAPFLFAATNLAIFSLIDSSLYHVQSVSLFALCLAMIVATPRVASVDGK